MTRILTAAVLLPIVVGIVWSLPPIATFVLVAVVLALAFVEYAAMARRGSPAFPTTVAGIATLATYAGLLLPPPVTPGLVLGVVLLVLGAWAVARLDPAQDVLRAIAVAALPALYLAVPLALASTIRARWGALILILPFLAIVISDSAQYFGGRAFGRRPLAPAISPKKTIEGAVTGFVVTTAALTALGPRVVADVPMPAWLAFGPVLVAAGIAGDLFESLLKRSVGVKDSSTLLPGHGGILDRIDALLFAFPAFYVFMLLAGQAPT